MLGWEFPPYNVGGLGIACEGLARSFVDQGIGVTFIMPKAPLGAKSDFCKLVVADHEDVEIDRQDLLKIKKVDSVLKPYMSENSYKDEIQTLNYKEKITRSKSEFDLSNQYGDNLFEEVYRYSFQTLELAKKEDFDLVHAHDWMTFQAGSLIKKVLNKPLVIHIHNTAFDRSGGNPNPEEYRIELEGFKIADKIIAISNFVKNNIISKYGISSDKIEVVHNGIDTSKYKSKQIESNLNKHKVVLFAGRVTLQKGPDYFIKTAKKVSNFVDDVKFVLAGNGDMLNKSIEMVAELGLSDKFVFPGRYSKEEGEKLMSMADVFVMPSVSEPFGLVPLEAMIQGTPTIISKQSGVSEVVTNTLKADFWDIDALTNKIVATLKFGALKSQLEEYGAKEVQNLTWHPASNKCKRVFESVLN